MQPFERGGARFDQSFVVLCKIAYGGFVSPDDVSAGEERAVVAAGFAQLGVGTVGEFASSAFSMVVLPTPLRPEQSDLFSAHNAGGEIAESPSDRRKTCSRLPVQECVCRKGASVRT